MKPEVTPKIISARSDDAIRTRLVWWWWSRIARCIVLARISHTIFARSGGVARRFVRTCWLVASGGRERSWDFPGLRGAAKTWSRWAWD